MTFKTYTAAELSNDDYHGEQFKDYLSGSDLAMITAKSPAHWKYAEREETAALAYGTAAHTHLLEPDLFAANFAREPSNDDYELILSSDAAMKAFLKEKGQKGYSTKSSLELVEMVRVHDQQVPILKELTHSFEASLDGKTPVKAKDFDSIQKMRNVIFGQPAYAEMLMGAEVESSIVGELEIDGEVYKVKVRPDIISKSGDLIDYKTTIDAAPEAFGRSCFNNHYYLKEALKHDVMWALTGEKPNVILLAQEKKSPYIPQAYHLTEAQLQYGREQYQTALKIHKQCLDSGVWFAYGGGVKELLSPAWSGVDEPDEDLIIEG